MQPMKASLPPLTRISSLFKPISAHKLKRFHTGDVKNVVCLEYYDEQKNADSIVFLFRRQQLKHNYAPVTDPLTHQYTEKSVSVVRVYFTI